MDNTFATTASAATTPATKQKAETVITTVKMDDGRIVEFAGKKRMQKVGEIRNDSVSVRLDFVNGETRSYTIVPELLQKFALHGAEQKLGDEIAGLDDVDDAVEAVDALIIRLQRGEWNVKRATGNGLAGTSILVRALVELTGKPVQAIRESLASKTMEEKMALRKNGKLRPIIDRLEALKASRKEKKSGIDSDALLDTFTSDTVNVNALGTGSNDEQAPDMEQAAA
jgi:hypothetical protein